MESITSEVDLVILSISNELESLKFSVYVFINTYV